MATHEFTLSAGDLDSGGRQYVFPIRAAWMRGALEDHEATASGPDGEIDVRASMSGDDVVVHGTLSAELVVPCARCLEPVRFDVHEPVSALYVPRTSLAGREPRGRGEKEISPQDADALPYDGETVVLDDLVRDELILQTPSFPLCSEDCPGMSAHIHSPGSKPRDEKSAPPPDVDHDIDPRLLPLRRLMDPKE